MLKYNKYDIIFGEFPDRDGSIQSGYRPGIVIQNNIGNTYFLIEYRFDGLSPSGKAQDFDSCIRQFESA